VAVVEKTTPPTLREVVCGADKDCTLRTAVTRPVGEHGEANLVVVASTPASAEVPCKLETAWLVHLAGDGTVVEHRRAGVGCAEDTEYGVACDGLQVLRLEPPKIKDASTITLQWDNPGPGCGGWTRASGGIEVSLDSFAMRGRTEWSGRAAAPDDSTAKTWDFVHLRFKTEWDAGPGPCPKIHRGALLGVPKLQLGAAFLGEGWRDAKLDRCATRFDGEHGVALPGSRKSKASLQAVISDTDALFVDVTEAADARSGAVLQVCGAEWGSRMYDYCSVGLVPDCVRVALDGRVLAGHAEVQRASDKPRFRIQLPPEQNALTVSYIEANGRSIGSSAYRAHDATSLGDVYGFEPQVATCRLTDGELRFSFTDLPATRDLLDVDGWD